MKTDTIFYSLFQEFPSIFFELINKSPTEATRSKRTRISKTVNCPSQPTN
ncbi:DUF2887 domain-containing protein [Sphaerospermopsis sp. LEGE 08334]|nr:DUF2887 domain-containing protein [Sphaerospermopsis sp. LEGE 08334]